MPLIKDGHFVADDWTRVHSDGGAPDAPSKLLMSWEDYQNRGKALAGQGYTLGVEINNDIDPDILASAFADISLIAVQFPKSADGRGFSLATRLRRLGFNGELRAAGYMISDQYALARSCGFDTVEISDALAERQPEPHWMEAQRSMSLAYQRGYGKLRNILSSRWT